MLKLKTGLGIFGFATTLTLLAASCGSGSYSDKKECVTDRLKPLIDRARLGDSLAVQNLNSSQVLRYADECGMTDDEKARLLTEDLGIEQNTSAPIVANPAPRTPRDRPRSWPTANPSPEISVLPGASPVPTPSPTAAPSPTVTPTPSVTPAPTATPSAAPSATVTPTPSATPAPSALPVITPPFADIPEDDRTKILAKIPADNFCRIRRFGPSAGTAQGFVLLAGKRVLSTRPMTTLSDAISAFRTEKSRMLPNCRPMVTPETCTLRYRSFSRTGSYGGFYAAIEGNDLSASGSRASADAARIVQSLNAERICNLAPAANCQLVEMFAPKPGFVIINDQMGPLNEQPVSQADAQALLQKFKTERFCK